MILTGSPGTHLWPFLAQKHKGNFLPKNVLNLNLSFYTSAILSKKYEEFRFTHFFKLKKHSLGNIGPKSLQQDSPYQKKFIYISVKPLCMLFQHHARNLGHFGLKNSKKFFSKKNIYFNFKHLCVCSFLQKIRKKKQFRPPFFKLPKPYFGLFWLKNLKTRFFPQKNYLH